MRRKNEYKKISITPEVHEMLKEDRDHFEAVIGGGRWSISDTIIEYKKIIRQFEAVKK